MNDPQLILKLALSLAIAAAITAGIVVAGLELRWLKSRRQLGRECKRNMWLSLSALPPNALVSILMAPVWTGIYVTASHLTSLEIPLSPGAVVLALLACDFSYYWEHRCSHRVRPLWHLYHAIHHSSDAYTVATAYRVSFLTQLLAPAFYIPWILLGMEPVLVAGFALFAFHYQAWLHTEMIGALGRWDHWLNTPANHRMHHSRAAEHRDVNMGAILIVWDRLFGTYASPERDVVYGIHGESPPHSALELYTHTWRRPWTI